MSLDPRFDKTREPDIREYPVFAVDFQGNLREFGSICASYTTETRHVHLRLEYYPVLWGEPVQYKWIAEIKKLDFIDPDDPVTDLIETAASEGIEIDSRNLEMRWT